MTVTSQKFIQYASKIYFRLEYNCTLFPYVNGQSDSSSLYEIIQWSLEQMIIWVDNRQLNYNITVAEEANIKWSL